MAFFFYLSDTSLKVFRYVFFSALAVEIFVTVISIYQWKIPVYTLYHFYIPLEYGLLTFYFYKTLDQEKIKKIAKYSIPCFTIFSLVLSQFHIGWTNFPGLNLNIEGILLCFWAIVALFSVKPHLFLPIYRLPIFWICLAVIIYHSGTFVMNGLFNVLRQNRYEVFESLRGVINKNINNLLYMMFIIAFVCSHQMKKYS
ncbi:hypothetical protein DYBT9275_01186 [Dyadobacter sp. CECT 9275]|uniref:Uncharacterized protein n=1 Tax=Dyadobacter helix TaxID=2822344 RepID=A0A916J9N0_9BACT|nr:hypothetical protein DYBT9275_01186 [Dyadobacter sp. CECT 9275]